MIVDLLQRPSAEPRLFHAGSSPSGERLAQSGSLELRLAGTAKEVRKAQRLRYKVFFEQGGARPAPESAEARRDVCPFDDHADHLIVMDTAHRDETGRLKPRCVGTYRLTTGERAAAGAGFYTGTEFDVRALVARHPARRFLELGRSCVHRAYRSRRVIELLWRGIGLYAARHGSDVLIGCASLPGLDLDALAIPMGFVRHFAAAEPDWQAPALAGRGIDMARIGKAAIDPRAAMAALPRLLKAYIRFGSRFGTQAVVDRDFNCIDLFTVLPLTSADPRYLAQFGAAAGSVA